jgi:iron-sulfur cluster repair protein YtfE (RIC family)
MAHTCHCSHDTAPAHGAPVAAADRTVGDVSRDPRALDILKRMGINHCCGAHLSLREAAAAAGVALEDLLCALDMPGR